MIKAIFFDVGHTLVRPALPTAEYCCRFLAAHGHVRDGEQVKAAMHTADVEHMAHYHALTDDWAHPHTIHTLWVRYYQHVFALLDIADPQAQLAHALIAWYGQPAAWQPFPEVRTVLADLHGRGYLLGAVSDWAPTLPAILHGHGLTRYLAFVLGSGTMGFCKPSFQFYRLALQRSGVQPDEAMHVGDSYYADVRGARTAGIRPVLLDRSGNARQLDCAVIGDLQQLSPLLDSTES